jgi:hypothetical protein
MPKALRFFASGIAILLLSLITSTSFAQATVTGDAEDYAPRSTAIFTGAGFLPGETVLLKVKNLSYPCNTVFADSSYIPWTAVADENGAFVTEWLVCDCPGDSLRLKATGETSGLIAYDYFTDERLAAYPSTFSISGGGTYCGNSNVTLSANWNVTTCVLSSTGGGTENTALTIRWYQSSDGTNTGGPGHLHRRHHK